MSFAFNDDGCNAARYTEFNDKYMMLMGEVLDGVRLMYDADNHRIIALDDNKCRVLLFIEYTLSKIEKFTTAQNIVVWEAPELDVSSSIVLDFIVDKFDMLLSDFAETLPMIERWNSWLGDDRYYAYLFDGASFEKTDNFLAKKTPFCISKHSDLGEIK